MALPRTLLALAGSPRAGGNTDTLLDWALAAAEQEGARVVKFRLCDLKIEGCTACETCFEGEECCIQDDFQVLLPHLRSAESILLAAPVFSLGLPAQVKAFVDRCQPFWATQERMHKRVWPADRPDRRGAFLSCAGSNINDVFQGSRRTLRYLWRVLEAQPVGELMVPGVDAAGDILREPGARPVAEEMGRRLAVQSLG